MSEAGDRVSCCDSHLQNLQEQEIGVLGKDSSGYLSVRKVWGGERLGRRYTAERGFLPVKAEPREPGTANANPCESRIIAVFERLAMASAIHLKQGDYCRRSPRETASTTTDDLGSREERAAEKQRKNPNVLAPGDELHFRTDPEEGVGRDRTDARFQVKPGKLMLRLGARDMYFKPIAKPRASSAVRRRGLSGRVQGHGKIERKFPRPRGS